MVLWWDWYEWNGGIWEWAVSSSFFYSIQDITLYTLCFSEQDSDFDYEEPYSSRRKKRGRASTGRGRGAALSSNLAETPARRGRGRGVGRSKKVAQIGPPPMDTSSNSSDKFVDFTRSRRGVQMPPQQPIPTGPVRIQIFKVRNFWTFKKIF